jgi:hypothetical protein
MAGHIQSLKSKSSSERESQPYDGADREGRRCEIRNVPGRHPSIESDLAVSDTPAQLGRQPSTLDGRDDLPESRVRGLDAGRTGRVRRRAFFAELEGVAVGDLVGAEDVGGEGGDDVEDVVLDEGVPVFVELAVSGRGKAEGESVSEWHDVGGKRRVGNLPETSDLNLSMPNVRVERGEVVFKNHADLADVRDRGVSRPAD